MRIVIGITQDRKRMRQLLTTYAGTEETLTEMGPFLSKEEAQNWMQFLESKIAGCREIPPEQGESEDLLWYGFTFEEGTD
ncbi:hypothetical protein JWJ90_18745 [Desulfobulbus rhabdoformis]|uniref:hypothetical protein n=1 Tax=Desulfobulbus rhabdoformis TaxID=34032 RepID=UPI0019659AA4|nr:hypothetical protein [Desulfobulbus rhabdoformis]MBM9616308.1 hypothetical protein [Desulfobulbus rhabdoformis]